MSDAEAIDGAATKLLQTGFKRGILAAGGLLQHSQQTATRFICLV